MKKLGVNIDHVATLRQARQEIYPDPIHAAQLAEMGGADQITVHLREDRRHIQDRDLTLLRETVQVPLNLEMAATKEMLAIALKVKPDCVTLVPEKREELTTEGGLDLLRNSEAIKNQVEALREARIVTSAFIETNLEQVRAAHRLNFIAVEFHTGSFCDNYGKDSANREYDKLTEAIQIADKLKLEVRLGHGIDYSNIQPLLNFPQVKEFNIGHAIIARAVLVGMERAVCQMKSLLK